MTGTRNTGASAENKELSKNSAAGSQQRHDSSYKGRRGINTTHHKVKGAYNSPRTFYTLYSGPADQAPQEKTGEVHLWREDFDFFKDAEPEAPRTDDATIEGLEFEGLDEFMAQAADCLGLGRGLRLILEPEYEIIGREERSMNQCRVPTPGKHLSVTFDKVPLGLQKNPMEEPVQDCTGFVCALRPLWDGPESPRYAPRKTSTLAQKFRDQPSTKWLNNSHPNLQLDVPVNRKMLIWARMMLVNQEDRDIMKKTGIFRGVLASIYQCKVETSLVAAFLTYWNPDGHTLVTSQGEMGYPLHTISDAMGIPFTGRLYEEFIPLPSAVRGHVRSLQAIYASLCPVTMKAGPGLVTLTNWINHFFDDQADSFGKKYFSDGFANPEDPLLQKLGFQVKIQDDQPTAVLGDQVLHYRVAYPSVVYRAAFIAAWLCTYCIPIEAGHYIRPEVFQMAVKIAEGGRRAISISSMAFLYRTLDDVHNNIISGTRSASECSLFIPGHFIMGWFASYWKQSPKSASQSCPIQSPPFIIDFREVRQIGLSEAHHLFWDFDSSGYGLRALDFLGRTHLRFPKNGKAICIQDGRIRHQGVPFAISISAMELLISCSVGGVTHRRGERFDNLVYCPQRFARMFNCDQLAPDFSFRADDHITDSLDFQSYSPNNREESLQILLRRHISRLRRPEGHIFFAQPLHRGTRCSIYYIAWCNNAFGFLQHPDHYCDNTFIPSAISSTAADNTEKEYSSRVSASSPVPSHGKKDIVVSTQYGKGKSTDVMEVQEDKEDAPVSSLSHKGSFHQSSQKNHGSPVVVDEIDSVLSKSGLAIPDDDLNSLPMAIFDNPISTSDLLKGLSNDDISLPNTGQTDTAMVAGTLSSPVQELAHSEETPPAQLAKQENASIAHQESLVTSQMNLIETANVMSTHELRAANTPVLRDSKETEGSQPKRGMNEISDVANLDPKRRRTSISAEQADPESIIAESKRLWASIEPISNKLKSEKQSSHDVRDKPRENKFDTHKPVSLSKLMQDRSSRFMNYVRVDLQSFKDTITKYPLDKERVVSEIDGITKVWADWFKPPPLEIKRLLDGFSALREALTSDSQSLVADHIIEQDQAHEKAAATKSYQDTVTATFASMVKVTEVFEDQLSSQELQVQQHMSHAQELRIQIQALNSKLRQVEDAHDQAKHLKDHIAHCLSFHISRVKEADSLKSALEQMCSQDQVRLQDLEKMITRFTKQDEMGVSERVRSLFDFFISSSES